MKDKAILIALVYSALYIAAICFAFYGHYEKILFQTYFIGMAAILPLVFLTIKLQRDTVYKGVMSSKEAMKEGMKMVFFSFVFLLGFQIIFFYSGFRDYKMDYTRLGEETYWKAQIALKKTTKTPQEIEALVNKSLGMITLSAEIFGVFLRTILIGLFSSFIASMFLKKGQ